jgi:type IV pilus assembly protein PilN
MNINLLPWREERKRLRDRKMVANGVLIWILCGVLLFSGFTFYKNKQKNQSKRNNYLTQEIKKLDEKIKEIKTLREQKENLLLRMQVIQDLQSERRRVVHLFDDIVRKLPEGVYYRSLSKKKRNFNMQGTAQSNARVSDLMNRLDSSEWFANPSLNVIDVTPRQGVRISEFKLRVSEEKKEQETFVEEVN